MKSGGRIAGKERLFAQTFFLCYFLHDRHKTWSLVAGSSTSFLWFVYSRDLDRISLLTFVTVEMFMFTCQAI